MTRIKVAVSPFYGGEEWTDELTGITFKKDTQHQMAVYSIPEGKDLSGIAKAIRINALLLVEGKLDFRTVEKSKQVIAEKEPEVVAKAPVEEKIEEAAVVEAEEVEVKKPTPARKKTTTKK